MTKDLLQFRLFGDWFLFTLYTETIPSLGFDLTYYRDVRARWLFTLR